MTKECIEREVAISEIDEWYDMYPESDVARETLSLVKRAIKKLPAADVRDVVTCEECDWHVDVGYHYCNKWCQPCPDNAEFFCAYGERPIGALT